ncbi:efflux RND transporter periplasmic adaptor subunit [Swingsia samuiensis]|uniref:Efflux RND transporter periplasmic adaptor subunit n=1 Tax=Swingsia samuiensis TaxID=1293412 RepID=A0A4Y6UH04_9PROT|nr:efflux RND transporter periplasmic adaptor subunit [Swingsia samuiensis]QDH16859.1 efflux RND transporter periplasmic adaptor subunit [Swingsia samuiensis]
MRFARVGALTLGLVGVVLILGFFLKGCFKSPVQLTSPEQPMFSHENGSIVVKENTPLQKRLEVAPVVVAPHVMGVQVPAQVMALPDHQVNVLAPVTGRILSVLVKLGQHVSKGQVLAIIAAGDLDQAWADDRRARAALDFAKRAYNRSRDVQGIGGNAVKDLESAHNDLLQAEAEAQRTSHRLQVLGSQSQYAARGQVPLVSPVDGVVSTTTMAPGQNITDATAVQMTLMDLSAVWVAAAVPENRVTALASATMVEATFPALPRQRCTGPIASRDPTLKADTRRLNVYVVCPNSEGVLRPGMYATATLDIPEDQVVLLPKSALLMNNDRTSVFIETAPRTFQRRDVAISYDDGDNVKVISGLKAGERIVTSGAILLNDD